MNYVSLIVKIMKTPEQVFFHDTISVTEMICQFVQIRDSNYNGSILVSTWGNLAGDLSKYYKKNDFIIIEGYLSLIEPKSPKILLENSLNKTIKVSVFKIYPFFFKKSGRKENK